jgi:glycosyltransferase involved in cell wall biosynthesis
VADLAIVGQDPGFAGGVLAQTNALWRAAVELGREPELHYLRVPRLDAPRAATSLDGRGVQPLVPGLEALNALAAAAVIAPRIRTARARFVCAATASNGFGAVVAAKPFGCWAGTSLADEAPARRRGVDLPRRIAHGLSDPGLRRLERETIRAADVRWATSPSSRRAIAAAAGIDESTVRVVPIPVDTSRFFPLDDDEWKHGLERPELVFVGRADDPRKNVTLLLDGYARLRSRMPLVRLTLVGMPPDVPLPDGAAAAGTVASVAEMLRRAALFVLPSLQEGFGIVVAEALASGVPVLVTPCGGPEDLVRDSRGGEIMSGFDPEELAERAQALLQNPGGLAEMRRSGRAYVVREHDGSQLRDALAEALEVLDRGE